MYWKRGWPKAPSRGTVTIEKTGIPADAYFGREKAIITESEKIKKLTIQQRRLQHQKRAALSITQTNQSLQNSNRSDVPFYMTTDSLISALRRYRGGTEKPGIFLTLSREIPKCSAAVRAHMPSEQARRIFP